MRKRKRRRFSGFYAADGTIADGAWAASFQLWIRLQSWTVRSRERVLLGILMPRFQEFAQEAELSFVALRHPVARRQITKREPADCADDARVGRGSKIVGYQRAEYGWENGRAKIHGMAALSAQSGIPVAAQRAVLPMFDRVLLDIGDEQSIAADLSTFSSHMLNLKSILALATQNSLVLVDEMGTGTAPEEGAALAVHCWTNFERRIVLCWRRRTTTG